MKWTTDGVICGICGWGCLMESEDGSLDCLNCFNEWDNRQQYLADLKDLEMNDWLGWDPFFQKVMGSREMETGLGKLAVTLLRCGVEPVLVETILHAMNSGALPDGQVGDILIRAAQSLAGGAA